VETAIDQRGQLASRELPQAGAVASDVVAALPRVLDAPV